MSNDNSVTLVGTATRDPEIRFTPSGATVASFGIARNTRRKNPQTQEWEDGEAQFYDVKAWGTLAENIAETVKQGQRVIIFGELEYRAWETDSGDKRSKIEVKAEAVGPDLRWASASVTKNEKSNGNSSQSRQQASSAPVVNPFE